LPPGCTPEQFAMKSERQLARMALVCADVGCCAWAQAKPSVNIKANASPARRTAWLVKSLSTANLELSPVNAIIAP
jgi:hypothetical protein